MHLLDDYCSPCHQSNERIAYTQIHVRLFTRKRKHETNSRPATDFTQTLGREFETIIIITDMDHQKMCQSLNYSNFCPENCGCPILEELMARLARAWSNLLSWKVSLSIAEVEPG